MTRNKTDVSKTIQTDLYKKAWAKWGDLQWLMVIEECSELQKAIVKYLRKKDIEREAHIAEECADVEIMLGQLRARSYLFNAQVNYYKREKLLRLADLLKTPAELKKEYLTFKTTWGKVTLKKGGFKEKAVSPMSKRSGEWLD